MDSNRILKGKKMKYAHYETDTKKLLGWYDDEIHSYIPTPNIEVDEAIWQNSIDNNFNFVDEINKTLSKKDFRTDIEILEDLKIEKLFEIESSALASDLLPIAFNGESFNGGESSASAIYNVVNMTRESNRLNTTNVDTVNITDINNLPISMTLDEATGLALSIAQVVQVNFQSKQAKKVQIKNATTLAEVNAIAWGA